MRLFVVDPCGDSAGNDWSELTEGDQPTVRLAASDLKRAQRDRARIRSDRDDVAVILDVTVDVAADFRSVRGSMASGVDGTLRYAGTVDGLTGLISDIERADVADGVTLISARASGQPLLDLRGLGQDVLRRLELSRRASA